MAETLTLDGLDVNGLVEELKEESRNSRYGASPLHEEIVATLTVLQAELSALKANNERLRGTLKEYLYETTHLATPQVIGGREYRNALIPYNAVKDARAALGKGGE